SRVSRISASASTSRTWLESRSVRLKGRRFAISERELELLSDLDQLVALELVADLDVVVVLEVRAALVTAVDLHHLLLEAAQRVDLGVDDHAPIADEAHLATAEELALQDRAAGDGADLGDREGLAHR